MSVYYQFRSMSVLDMKLHTSPYGILHRHDLSSHIVGLRPLTIFFTSLKGYSNVTGGVTILNCRFEFIQ